MNPAHTIIAPIQTINNNNNNSKSINDRSFNSIDYVNTYESGINTKNDTNLEQSNNSVLKSSL